MEDYSLSVELDNIKLYQYMRYMLDNNWNLGIPHWIRLEHW